MTGNTIQSDFTAPSNATRYPYVGNTGNSNETVNKPIDFSQAANLQEKIGALEKKYSTVSQQFAELKATIEGMGEQPLTSYSVKKLVPFTPSSTLPFPEMFKSMESHYNELDLEIKFFATAKIEMENQIKNIEKVSNYINSLNPPAPAIAPTPVFVEPHVYTASYEFKPKMAVSEVAKTIGAIVSLTCLMKNQSVITSLVYGYLTNRCLQGLYNMHHIG